MNRYPVTEKENINSKSNLKENIEKYKKISILLNVKIHCLHQRAVLSTMEIIYGKEIIRILNENMKAIRKSKGLSQQQLAVKLNVVRQTISKWEQGLSVPDSDMLIIISEVLETPVSTLLGETVAENETDDLKVIY